MQYTVFITVLYSSGRLFIKEERPNWYVNKEEGAHRSVLHRILSSIAERKLFHQITFG